MYVTTCLTDRPTAAANRLLALVLLRRRPAGNERPCPSNDSRSRDDGVDAILAGRRAVWVVVVVAAARFSLAGCCCGGEA
jgi:hypothetical protein